MLDRPSGWRIVGKPCYGLFDAGEHVRDLAAAAVFCHERFDFSCPYVYHPQINRIEILDPVNAADDDLFNADKLTDFYRAVGAHAFCILKTLLSQHILHPVSFENIEAAGVENLKSQPV